MADLTTLKQEVFTYVANRLGEGIVDLELDPTHYETAYERSLNTYRTRAQNAYEESYSLLTLVKNQNTYVLPAEVQSVRQVFRRTMGDSTGGQGTSFDPFSSATLNVYLLNYTNAGGLATFEMYTQYVEMAMRMFGGYMNYNFAPVTKQLTIMRDPKASGEQVLLWTYNLKPETILLQDIAIKQWIRDFTYAGSKMIIGEAREKFATIAGPQGGTPLNGSSLKAEAQAEMDRLIQDLSMFVDHSEPLSWVIG
jgi:hypothetical protein